MKHIAWYIYGILLTQCLYVSLAGIQGVILTTKREPINPDIKKRLTNVIINRPEELAVDERIFIKVPDFLKNTDYKLVNAASDYHIMASHIKDFIDAIVNQVKTRYQEDMLITKKDKQHIFEIIAQTLHLETPMTHYFDLEEKYRATDFFNTINYIQECQCFSRRSHPFRKEVEKRILKHLEVINFDKSKTLTVTEFASGNLFEIFMIANLLIEHGYKNLQLNCIDLEYRWILEKYRNDLSKKEIKTKNGSAVFSISSYPWKKMQLSEDQIQEAKKSRLFYPITTMLERLQAYLKPRNKEGFQDLSKTEFKQIQNNFKKFESELKKLLSEGLSSAVYDQVNLVQTNLAKLQTIDFKDISSHKTTIEKLEELMSAITQKLNDPNRVFIEDELARDYTILKHILSMNLSASEEEISNRFMELEPLISSFEAFESHQRIAQFLRWFADDKNNNVTVVFYDDVQNYLDDCSNNEKLKSDIIVAIDYYPWETFKFWDKLRTDALKKDGAAFTVLNLSASGDHLTDEQYYLSIGTPTTLEHYELILPAKEKVTWQEQTRLVPTVIKKGKKLEVQEIKKTFKIPNYTKYKLKKIHEIPQSKAEIVKENAEGVWEETMETIPAIPEITSNKKNNNAITLFAQSLSTIAYTNP